MAYFFFNLNPTSAKGNIFLFYIYVGRTVVYKKKKSVPG